MEMDVLLLGIDGGGTRCRARLSTPAGEKLGEAITGPANLRLGLEQSLGEVMAASRQCLHQAGLHERDLSRIAACLALAGASEPNELKAARARKLPYRNALFTTDAHAACVGAHRGRDGGVIVIGTGSIGWGVSGGRHYRVGGWGLPLSDEGSGAWLGRELLRRVLWAHDGRAASSALTDAASVQFQRDPHAIVRFAAKAMPRDFGAFAPLIVEHAHANDAVAVALMQRAAAHIDRLAARLIALGVTRLALVGGLAREMERWVSRNTAAQLVPPAGDALDGALQLAQVSARSAAA